VPLWGIVEDEHGNLCCECGKPSGETHKPGKHPRSSKWREKASDDPIQIATWLQKYPHANFGIVCGERVIAVDADERPRDGKFGAQSLEWLELDHRQRLPYTVTVDSGRGNGSKHLYFTPPKNIDIERLKRPIPDVDLIKKGYCVAPGSRHIEGGYYRFADELSPDEQDVAELPQMLLDLLCPDHDLYPGHDQKELKLPKPGRERPDWVVRNQLYRDKVTKPLFFDGERRYPKDRSADDFALACKLAFYCTHHWDQAIRLFKQSKLYAKNHSWSTGDYVTETMTKAFLHTESNWIERPRQRASRATGGKVGRKVSTATTAVLDLKKNNPAMTPKDIAGEIGLTPAHVRKILSRMRHGFYAPEPEGVTQFRHANTQNTSVPYSDPNATPVAVAA